jgi:hypothetical protein
LPVAYSLRVALYVEQCYHQVVDLMQQELDRLVKEKEGF